MKKISNSYSITAVLGAQFDYDGVPSFVLKAIPEGSTEEETFILPYAHCWNETAYIQNNHLKWTINPYIKDMLTWGPLSIPDLEGTFFDAAEGWAIRLE